MMGAGEFVTAVVERVCFSPDALTMVTADRRPPKIIQVDGAPAYASQINAAGDDLQLKFWMRASPQDAFVLHTRVERPHDLPVTALLYHNSAALAVSVGRDGRLRIWLRKGGKAPPRKQPQHLLNKAQTVAPVSMSARWQCRATAVHQKALSANDAAFSPDGSLLAVVFGAAVTLWSPFRVILLQTLVYPSSQRPHIDSVRFVHDTSLLVTASRTELSLWDVVCGTVVRSYRLGVASLCVHPSLPIFAVLAKLKRVGGAGAAQTEARAGTHNKARPSRRCHAVGSRARSVVVRAHQRHNAAAALGASVLCRLCKVRPTEHTHSVCDSTHCCHCIELINGRWARQILARCCPKWRLPTVAPPTASATTRCIRRRSMHCRAPAGWPCCSQRPASRPLRTRTPLSPTTKQRRRRRALIFRCRSRHAKAAQRQPPQVTTPSTTTAATATAAAATRKRVRECTRACRTPHHVCHC